MSEHISAVEAQRLLDSATPGEWEVRTAPHPDDDETPAEWLASCLTGGDVVWCVVAPNTTGDGFDYLVPAVTGDGPFSEAHAELIAAAPRLAAEVVRLRRELDERTDQLRTPAEWQPIVDVVIYDPDGWRMDEKPWDEPITEAEFRRRAMHSTVKPGPRFMAEAREAAARLLGGGE